MMIFDKIYLGFSIEFCSIEGLGRLGGIFIWGKILVFKGCWFFENLVQESYFGCFGIRFE